MSGATTIDAQEITASLDPAARTRVYLVVREGERARVIGVDEGAEIVFGRSPEATVQLDDATASREHARVVRRDGLSLVDLGSRNGTRLNDEVVRRQSRPLRSGDVVAIGAASILVAETAGVTDDAAPGEAAAPETKAAGELARLLASRGQAAPLPPLPGGVVVGDPAMARLFALVRKVAPTPTTVLVLGETGSGKEVVAEQLHRLGGRPQGPFVRLNCGSLPEMLLESELFGHEKGAFTGADRKKSGYIEAADGGTLFLDEVGELSLSMQTRLLRVLEDHKLMRVGGRKELSIDVRIVAATNRPLEDEVAAGRFRSDLYFRLSAFVLRVPPLRERMGELELFADLFARQFARRMNVRPPTITTAAMARLRQHRWPGNIRELRNTIEHAVVVADGGEIGLEQLPETLLRAPTTATAPSALAPAPSGGAMRAEVADVERRRIQEALDAEGGNQTRAAKRLGISRRALQYKLEKYDLRDKSR